MRERCAQNLDHEKTCDDHEFFCLYNILLLFQLVEALPDEHHRDHVATPKSRGGRIGIKIGQEARRNKKQRRRTRICNLCISYYTKSQAICPFRVPAEVGSADAGPKLGKNDPIELGEAKFYIFGMLSQQSRGVIAGRHTDLHELNTKVQA